MKFYSLLAVVALSSSKLTQEHSESMIQKSESPFTLGLEEAMMKEKMQEKHITSILDAYKDMKSGGSKTEEPVKKESEEAEEKKEEKKAEKKDAKKEGKKAGKKDGGKKEEKKDENKEEKKE